ncbi:MAG: PaaI family thioesterase [Pseudomonadales bacterium]|nr:PaaI family thioesterase [Pseudomonadales bacterium]
MTSDTQIPDDFTLVPAGVGFADVLAPLFVKQSEEETVLGMRVEKNHLNGINICHGGVSMILADICCAWNIRRRLDEGNAPATLNLSFDFLSVAKRGDWIETHLDLIAVKRRVGFAGGTVACGEKTLVRFNGTFFIPEPGRFTMREGVRERFDSLQIK